MMMRLCERVILENGGKKTTLKGKPAYRIKLQEPVVIENLVK